MINEDDFRDAVARHTAWTEKVFWYVIGAGLLLSVVPALADRALSVAGFTKKGPTYDCVAAGTMVGFFVYVLSAMFVAVWSDVDGPRRDPRLVCPQCGGTLYTNHRWVIATSRCLCCGWRVLGDRDCGENEPWSDAEP